ncbi:hypothetical protein FRC12_020385 [Ceratobasidium sp. 428]|nr:hypothetical protein FRC12_020385 [Ceratobasidium sp. 428]
MPAPTIFSSSTDGWVRPTASPDSAGQIRGGGPSCAQDCLAKAASGAGCSSFVDRQCICSSSTFRDLAKNCFGMSKCDASSASRALNDVNTPCQAEQAFTDVFRSSSSSHSSSSQSRPELSLSGSKYRVNQPPGGANIRPFIRRDTHYLRHADYAYRRDNDSPHTTHRHRRGKARM